MKVYTSGVYKISVEIIMNLKRMILNIARPIAKKIGVKKWSPKYGVKTKNLPEFFRLLDEKGLSYVALRWFEDLPNIKKGEDIDMLVPDKDFRQIQKMCRGARDNGKYTLFDIYPVSNMTGDYSYYVPEFALRILDGKVRNKNGIWVPNQRDYFFELAYHSLYHKGYRAGIPSKYRTDKIKEYKHDFNSILLHLAELNGIELKNGFTMENLESVLKANGWAPPIDVYYRRSKANEWVYDRAQELTPDQWRHNQETVVFIIREKAYLDLIDYLKQLINNSNAEILRECHLNCRQAEYLMRCTRGGDWGAMLPDRNTLGPASYVLVVQKKLRDITIPESTPEGAVTYAWVKEIKSSVRKEYLKQHNEGKDVHIIHTSDNGVEAAYYEQVLNEALNLNN